MEKINNNESKAVSTAGSVDQSGPPHSLGTPSSPDPWVLRLAEIEEAATDWVTKFQPRILIALTSFVERAIELSNLAHKSFTQRLGVYPHLAQAILPLAQRGWFISLFFGLSELDELAVIAARTPGKELELELDLYITKLYDEDIEQHSEKISKHFPERTFAVQPAVAAHQRGEYALSVPIFLMQADGICFGGSGKHLFRGQDDDNFISHAQELLRSDRYADKESAILSFYNLLWRILLTSMSDRLPLQYSAKERNTFRYTGLNRHTILHGISDSCYATKQNSLKAFSLLSCVASLLAHDVEDAEGTPEPRNRTRPPDR